MKLINPKFLFVILGQIAGACTLEINNSTERIVTEYYEVYNKRRDINRFMDFYADDILLEDIINGDRIEVKII